MKCQICREVRARHVMWFRWDHKPLTTTSKMRLCAKDWKWLTALALEGVDIEVKEWKQPELPWTVGDEQFGGQLPQVLTQEPRFRPPWRRATVAENDRDGMAKERGGYI